MPKESVGLELSTTAIRGRFKPYLRAALTGAALLSIGALIARIGVRNVDTGDGWTAVSWTAGLTVAIVTLLSIEGLRRALRRWNDRASAAADRQVRLDAKVSSAEERATRAERERDEERELALIDPVTGLANRRAVDEAFERARQRVLRAEITGFVVLAFDLNDFKQLNDTQGHLFGDEVLRAIADRLRIYSRGGSVVGRPGGDEFIVLVEGISEEEGRHLQRRMRTVFSNALIVNDEVLTVTVAVGMRFIESRLATYAEALEDADREMYADKRSQKARRSRRNGRAPSPSGRDATTRKKPSPKKER